MEAREDVEAWVEALAIHGSSDTVSDVVRLVLLILKTLVVAFAYCSALYVELSYNKDRPSLYAPLNPRNRPFIACAISTSSVTISWAAL